MLLINRPLTPAALARAVVTMTEGKSAALQRLAVPSKLHIDLATGTGTDQYCIAAPASGGNVLTSASPHMKLGEIIGRATRDGDARGAALAERPRGELHARACFTRSGGSACARRRCSTTSRRFSSEGDLELLKRNSKAAFYEPLVGAAAHALAVVCDRVRYGTLPASVAADAMAQQAATLAANLAAQAHRWPEFRSTTAAIRDWRREGAGAAEPWRSAGRRSGARVTELVRAPGARPDGCWSLLLPSI